MAKLTTAAMGPGLRGLCLYVGAFYKAYGAAKCM